MHLLNVATQVVSYPVHFKYNVKSCISKIINISLSSWYNNLT